MSFIRKTFSSYGSVTSWDVMNWKMVVVKGSNPKSEYLFKYEVTRKKGTTKEVIGMIKEDDEIKIVQYSVGL